MEEGKEEDENGIEAEINGEDSDSDLMLIK